jgi:hypothetical protein
VRLGDGRAAAFRVDVFAALDMPPERRPGRYRVSVSLGPHVSNVLEAVIDG